MGSQKSLLADHEVRGEACSEVLGERAPRMGSPSNGLASAGLCGASETAQLSGSPEAVHFSVHIYKEKEKERERERDGCLL